MFKHELGIEAKCRITKVKGIIISRSENINMCMRYFLQPQADKEMKIPEGYWIDEDDLIKINDGVFEKTKDTGGPMSKIR